jgi:7-keto-8-aminopelargonate synthetase-like enzyme
MDGDCAPLQRIAELAVQHHALLVVDDAHNVFPECAAPALDGLELLHVGTLSKTLGAMGGWVGGSQSLVDYLVNSARSLIFTTALAPADAAAALAALQICRSNEGEQLRTRLRDLVGRVRRNHHSAIVPIIVGSNAAALDAAEILLRHGVYVPAIRPPTVALGTARLRVTLSAAHDDSMLAMLLDALRAAGIEP